MPPTYDAFKDLLTRLTMDVTDLTDLLRGLSNNPLKSPRRLLGTIAAGQTALTLAHGLGRPYQGVTVQYATNLQTPLTAAAPGVDAGQSVTVSLGAVQGLDVTFAILVY